MEYIFLTIVSLTLILLLIFNYQKVIEYINKNVNNNLESKIIYLLLIGLSLLLYVVLIPQKFIPKAIILFLIILSLVSCILLKIFKEKKVKLTNTTAIIIVGVVCFVFSLILSLKTLPIAEGWYSVYAKYINKGLLPYKDFELLFMPLYSYIIAFVTNLFGYSFIVVRIFGVIIFTLIGCLMYVIYNKVFSSKGISIIVSIASAIYLQSEIVQIFYDYIRIFDLFTYVSVVCLLVYVENLINNKKRTLPIVLSGIFATLGFLIRQNSGALVIVYIGILLIFLIILLPNKKEIFVDLIKYTLSVVIPLIICIGIFYKIGILDDFLNKTTGSAIASKGGMAAVLFAWIPRVMENWCQTPIAIVFTSSIIIFNYLMFKKNKDIIKEYSNLSLGLFAALEIFVMIFACYYVSGITHKFVVLNYGQVPFIIFFIILELFFFEFVKLFSVNKMNKDEQLFHIKFFAFLGMIVAINYGSGTSASLSQGQSALGFGLVIGLLLYLSNHKYGNAIKVATLTVVVAFCSGIFAYKYINPYQWWGITVSDLRNQKHELKIKNFGNIYVSKEEKKIYTDIVNIVDNNSKKDDNVFAFPQIPLFYLMTDRYPSTYSLVQWFDVCSDDAINKDVKELIENNPRIIIHAHVPEFAVEAHETSFRSGQKSALRRMDNVLTNLEKHKYKLLKKYELQKYIIEIYLLEDAN